MITDRFVVRFIAAAAAIALSGCAGLDTPLAPLTEKPTALARPAGMPLAEDEAKRRAGDILSGTDYGESAFDVISRIKEASVVKDGSNDCGPVRAPLWMFVFDGPHKGALYIDAATGAKQCSSLPFAR